MAAKIMIILKTGTLPVLQPPQHDCVQGVVLVRVNGG